MNNKDFKVERIGDEFKLTCKVCGKRMVESSEFGRYMKTAMLSILKENGGDFDDPRMEDETRKRMSQLNICLHGGYQGVGYSLNVRTGEVKKVMDTDENSIDYSIKPEELPPSPKDQLYEDIAKRFAPIFIQHKKDGKSTQEILNMMKFVCFQVLGVKTEGFPMKEFEDIVSSMIEAAGKE